MLVYKNIDNFIPMLAFLEYNNVNNDLNFKEVRVRNETWSSWFIVKRKR